VYRVMERGEEATGALVHAGSAGDCKATRVQGFSERPVKGQVGAVILPEKLYMLLSSKDLSHAVG
jgi:hypothetical protein